MGKYGRHEILDRVNMLVNMWNEFVTDHPDLYEPEAQLSGEIEDKMGELYQMVGATNFREDDDEQADSDKR